MTQLYRVVTVTTCTWILALPSSLITTFSPSTTQKNHSNLLHCLNISDFPSVSFLSAVHITSNFTEESKSRKKVNFLNFPPLNLCPPHPFGFNGRSILHVGSGPFIPFCLLSDFVIILCLIFIFSCSLSIGSITPAFKYIQLCHLKDLQNYSNPLK